jgi:hypothetical protein
MWESFYDPIDPFFPLQNIPDPSHPRKSAATSLFSFFSAPLEAQSAGHLRTDRSH